jgi:hypothetical protein
MRTDYERPKPFKTRSVEEECASSVRIEGAIHLCIGRHAPRSKHRKVITSDEGVFVWLEWQ